MSKSTPKEQYEKVLRVIKSCTNPLHYSAAIQMVENYARNNPEYITPILALQVQLIISKIN